MVYVLVPNIGSLEPQLVHLGRAACRVAYHDHLIPIFPLLYCHGFMTEEEMDGRLTKESWRWLKRSSRIWLCSNEEAPALDPLSHDILLHNEGLMLSRPRTAVYSSVLARRIPVYRFSLGTKDGDAPRVSAMERLDIAHALRMNITSGLFRGVAL